MNDENLIPYNKRSKNEARENGKKGGMASGESRRRKKAIRTLAKELMGLPVSKVNEEKLKTLGVSSGSMSNSMLVLVSMLQEAVKGNVRAAEFLRDTMGESPVLELKRKELKLKEEVAKKAAGVQDKDDVTIVELPAKEYEDLS